MNAEKRGEVGRVHQPMGGSVLSLQPTRRPDGGDGWTLCSHYLSFSPHTRPLTTTKQQLKTNLSSLNFNCDKKEKLSGLFGTCQQKVKTFNTRPSEPYFCLIEYEKRDNGFEAASKAQKFYISSLFCTII